MNEILLRQVFVYLSGYVIGNIDTNDIYRVTGRAMTADRHDVKAVGEIMGKSVTQHTNWTYSQHINMKLVYKIEIKPTTITLRNSTFIYGR